MSLLKHIEMPSSMYYDDFFVKSTMENEEQSDAVLLARSECDIAFLAVERRQHLSLDLNEESNLVTRS